MCLFQIILAADRKEDAHNTHTRAHIIDASIKRDKKTSPVVEFFLDLAIP